MQPHPRYPVNVRIPVRNTSHTAYNESLFLALRASCEAFIERREGMGECWETYYMFPYQGRLWAPWRLMWQVCHPGLGIGRFRLYHRCVNPICINPDHIHVPAIEGEDPPQPAREPEREDDEAFWTEQLPRRIHTPRRPSAANLRSQLTEEQVRWIRANYTGKGTRSCVALGKMFCVTPSSIMNVIHRKTWKHLKDPEPVAPEPLPDVAAPPAPVAERKGPRRSWTK